MTKQNEIKTKAKSKAKTSTKTENKNSNKGVIVLCAGGSGGHMFPALSLAAELNRQGWKPVLFTDSRGSVFKGGNKNLQVFTISGEAVAGRSFICKVIAALKLGFGVIQSFILLKKLSPKAVVGFGGFASLPGCIAALLWKIPVVLHEQNAVLGRANRLLAKRAKIIITSFAKTKLLPKGAKYQYVGMPVRDEIAEKAAAPYNTPKGKGAINVLIIGGSQGAKILSRIVPSAFKMLPLSLQKRLNITQQCRKEDLNDVRLSYAGSGIKTELNYFFADIPEKMANAHLIISRSGSSTMAEIFTIGRPAILVPYRYAADNHQYENALSLNEQGGGWIICEEGITPELLSDRLISLFKNPDVLSQAASSALIKDIPKVTSNIAKIIMEIAGDDMAMLEAEKTEGEKDNEKSARPSKRKKKTADVKNSKPVKVAKTTNKPKNARAKTKAKIKTPSNKKTAIKSKDKTRTTRTNEGK